MKTVEQIKLDIIGICYRAYKITKDTKFLDMYFDLIEQFMKNEPVLDFSEEFNRKLNG